MSERECVYNAPKFKFSSHLSHFEALMSWPNCFTYVCKTGHNYLRVGERENDEK